MAAKLPNLLGELLEQLPALDGDGGELDGVELRLLLRLGLLRDEHLDGRRE